MIDWITSPDRGRGMASWRQTWAARLDNDMPTIKPGSPAMRKPPHARTMPNAPAMLAKNNARGRPMASGMRSIVALSIHVQMYNVSHWEMRPAPA